MTHQPDHNTVTMLVAAVQKLQADLQTLLDRTPNPDQIWLNSGDFAKLCGVSTSTIRAYRDNNSFRSESLREKTRGKRKDFLYHREFALDDFRKAQS